MRKLILYMFTTLDGFVAGSNGEFDEYEPSLEEHHFANELFGSMDGIFLGRKSYEAFVAYWDTLDLNDDSIPAVERDFSRVFRTLHRVVFSRNIQQVPEKTTLIHDDLFAQVTTLKAQPGRDFLLICGSELLAALVDQGLVDEVCLLIKPTVLGRGTTLFGDLTKTLHLQLLSTRVFESGAVMHRYQIK
ncbi:MAG: dihydrofolate reductase family protein [Caldilineaceae bacterium]